MVECSEVALFEKAFVIFTIKSMMYLRRFRLTLEETKVHFQLFLSEQNVIWVSEMDTRWRASNNFQGLLIVPDLRSCGMLSTLPLFYIVQSVDSDDRRARFQGLRVIMVTTQWPLCAIMTVPDCATRETRRLGDLGRPFSLYWIHVLWILTREK